MSLYKEITHNHCGCIFSTGIEDINCLKRYYVLNDYENGELIKLSICNEHLRLKISEYKHRTNTYRVGYRDIDRILLPIFKEYIKLYNTDYWGVSKGNNLSDKNISAYLCESPKILTHINIIEAIDIIRLNGGCLNQLKKETLRAIRDYINYNIKSKASKFKYDTIIALTKRIDKCWDNKERELMINELFITILQIEVKAKS
jgi:hypothetical protein